tara:strand:- start:2 stop:748 length:747 start_codon:yes stop_codon:yes gene_type:complete
MSVKNMGGGGDSERGLGFLMSMKYKRFVIANEVPEDTVFSGNAIKLFASGGDTLKARGLYKEPAEFKLECLPMLFCNDFPKIKGSDDAVKNRMRFLNCEYSYLNGSDYEKQKSNPNVKLGDDKIKTVFIKRPDVIKAFIYLVISNYRSCKPEPPQSVINETEEWSSTDNVNDKIKDLLEVGAETILFNDIYEHFISNDLTFSKTKAGKILASMGFQKIDKKMNGKKGLYYSNVAMINCKNTVNASDNY